MEEKRYGQNMIGKQNICVKIIRTLLHRIIKDFVLDHELYCGKLNGRESSKMLVAEMRSFHTDSNGDKWKNSDKLVAE